MKTYLSFINRMKNIFKLLILIVIILFAYLYVFKEGGILIFKDLEPQYNISDVKENDDEIIAEYFADGMKAKEYLKTVSQETEVLAKDTDEYSPINYDFEKLLKYSEVEDIVKKLNKSEAIKVEIIGKSVDKRSIYSIEAGYGDNIILFDANIHAAEVAGTMFILKYLTDLVNKYEIKDNTTTELFKNVKIIVIPSINPDGYEACLFGVDSIKNKDLYIYKNRADIIFKTYKGNANGIDINRNFPSQHGGLYYKKYNLSETVSSKPSLGYFDYYPGKRLGSEPETRAVMYWLNKYIEKSYAYIAIHSAGRVIYSGKPNLSDSLNNQSLKMAETIANINDYVAYGIEAEEVGYGNDGTATDYATELVSGLTYSQETGRLAADSYLNPTIKKDLKAGIITLETLEEYTFDLKKIKDEYYKKDLAKVFTALIKSYQ